MKNGVNIKIIGLSFLIIILFTGIIIVFNLLTKGEEIQEKNINKVAEKTYSKNISLNSAISPAPTTIIAPTTNITMSKALSPTPKSTLKLSPTTLLAKNSITPTVTIAPTPVLRSTLAPRITTTITPTITLAPSQTEVTPTSIKVTNLPKAGYWRYPLIIVIAAGVIITASLIF